MKLVSYADRPDLRARRHAELSGVTFPPYMHENEPGNSTGVASTPTFPLSRSRSSKVTSFSQRRTPSRCPGTLGDLPSGWEDGLTRG